MSCRIHRGVQEKAADQEEVKAVYVFVWDADYIVGVFLDVGVDAVSIP